MFKKFILILSCVLALSACEKKQRPANEIIVGTIAGPETALMEVVKQVAKQDYNIDVKIIEFNDYVLPNITLADGNIDANIFQHQPYLDATIKAKGYKLISIGKTFVYPMGIYSKKIKSFRELHTGDTVAIPNDPSNEARALLLLAEASVITLKDPDDTAASLDSITKNPLRLTFKEIDAAQLPRVLNDVTIAAINTNFAIVAGLLPSRDAIFMEASDSPYANIIVIREKDKRKTQLHQLLEAMRSNEVLNKAKELFKGQAIAAW